MNLLRVISLLFVVCAQVCAADTTVVDWKQVSEIHVPAESRGQQLAELVRQLGINAFVDFGYGWKDDEENNLLDAAHPPLESFAFKAGTISNALNAYSEKHPFQWHYWSEANAVWIEPKEEKRRNSYLISDQLPEWNLESAGISTVSVHAVNERWSTIRKCECYIMSPNGELMGIYNWQELPLSFVLEKGPMKSPGSVRAYISWWLKTHDRAVVGLIARAVGSDKAEPTLIMGSNPESLGVMPIQQVIPQVLNWVWAPNCFPLHLLKREVYRRTQFEKDKVIEALLKYDKANKVLFERGALFPTEWNPSIVSEILFSVFQSVSKKIQLESLEKSTLPQPSDFGPAVLGPWKTLSNSTIPEFRAKAKEVLDFYEEALKESKSPQ